MSVRRVDLVVRAIKGEDISIDKVEKEEVVETAVTTDINVNKNENESENNSENENNGDDIFSSDSDIIRDEVKYLQTMVFVNTADAASRLAFELEKVGVHCAEYHKFISDSEKQESLRRFRDEEVSVLVCTDHASRG